MVPREFCSSIPALATSTWMSGRQIYGALLESLALQEILKPMKLLSSAILLPGSLEKYELCLCCDVHVD